jgi:hypothetical protein
MQNEPLACNQIYPSHILDARRIEKVALNGIDWTGSRIKPEAGIKTEDSVKSQKLTNQGCVENAEF